MVKKNTTRKTKKKASSGAPKKVKRTAAAGGARKKKTSARSPSAPSKASAKKKATSKKKTSKTKSVTQKTQTVSKASTKKKTTRATGSTKKKTTPAAKKTSTKTSTKKKATGKKKTTSRRSGGKLRSGTVAEAASAASADSKGYVYINGRRVRMISRKSVPPPAKKPRATPKEDLVLEKPIEPAKVRKTKLSPEDLDHYRTLLLIKRAELVGDLSAMEAEALQASGNLSNVPIHMADIGTDTYDQDFMLGLAETERKQLREIDDALQRIEDKTYGVCQMTGRTIPKSRLNAKPWAKYTIGAARKIEEGGGR